MNTEMVYLLDTLNEMKARFGSNTPITIGLMIKFITHSQNLQENDERRLDQSMPDMF